MGYSNLSNLDFIQYALPVSFVGIISAVFLSEDTDRTLLRERIIYISLTQPLLAFGVYFFLREDGNLTQILILSFLSALVANLAAFSLTSYIESMFGLTS